MVVGPVVRAMMALLLAVAVAPSLLPLPALGAHSSLQSSQRLEDAAAAHLPPPPRSDEMGTLVHVQLLHRHGDRAPVHVSPADRPVWTERIGLRGGQLSRIGMAQLHAMGKFMRKTYIHESDTQQQQHSRRRADDQRTAQRPASRPVPVTFVPFVT